MKFLSRTLFEGGSLLRLPPDAGDVANDTGKDRVNIYPVEKQEILGFGGAFTESSAYTYAQLDAAGKAAAMERLFGKSGLRYNFCRICIGSSDFSLDQYDYLAPGATNLESFSIERARRYVIPMIHDAQAAAKAAGEEIVFFASPWSPPAFMKDTGSRVKGGRLLPEYREMYAEYFVKFIKAYAAEGIPVSAVTPQNETLAPSPWDSCLVSAEEEAALIRALSAAFAAHGLEVKILAWDHNKGRLYHRMEEIYREVPDLVAGAAFHWYSGQHFEELALMRERYPGKLLIASEFCNGLGRKIFDTYGAELMGNLTHGVQAECEWNLMLGAAGEPYHDRAFGCSAPIHSDGKNLTLRRSYFEMYLFSHFVRRGARALATSSFCEGLNAAAFRNPDGRLVVVVRNATGKTISYNLSVFNRLYPVSVTPDTMVTYEIEE
mgnify:FL=1